MDPTPLYSFQESNVIAYWQCSSMTAQLILEDRGDVLLMDNDGQQNFLALVS
jgi:hypothetical protein